MKFCKKCELQKPVSDFHKDKSKHDGLVSFCKECKSIYRKGYYQQDPDKFRAYSTNWVKENSEQHKAIAKKSRQDNIEHHKQKRKERYWLDPESAKIYNRNYARERAKKDPVYRLTLRCRKRIWAAIKEGGYTKKSKSFEMIGCSAKELMSFLEPKMTKGMTWENYGEWHIDHIIPLASAKTIEDVERLCHYSNLQPLWASENISKGARIDYS